MNLEESIAKWDGKSAADIGQIYDYHCREESFISQLITLIKNTTLQKGATWLLKKHLESDGKLGRKDCNAIYGLLSGLEDWESKLHALQCIPYMPIVKSCRKKVELFLRQCLVDDNKFVRAWAYNGFYELAGQYPEFQEETMQFFEIAMRDEAPSVKARIRNIMKRGLK